MSRIISGDTNSGMELRKTKSYFAEAWREAWTHRSFRVQALITLVVVLSFTLIFNPFFEFVEARPGTLLNDIVLDILPAHDVALMIFFFLYSGIIIGLGYHMAHPRTILVAFQTYVIVTVVRLITITLVPLEPPTGYIPMQEPFVQLFTSGGKIISKDLFFSGHMSTILSLFFASHRKYIRTFLLFCSLLISVMLLIQHVHYTIDVLVAVPATYLIYLFCRKYLGGKTY